MNWAEAGTTLLRETEAKLREFLASASTAGDYEAVVTLAGLAKSLAAVVEVPTPPQANLTKPTPTVVVAKRQGVLTKRRKRRKLPISKGMYPRFLRQADQLVKIGWSKSSKAEYQHKAPRTAVTLLASAMLAGGKDGAIFSAQDLSPLVDPADKSEVPNYQVYLALLWLRHNGLVVQHGRQGYTLTDAESLVCQIDECWESLPTK